MAKLALKGGNKTRVEDFHRWPVFDEEEEKAVNIVLKSGNWWRYSYATGLDMHESDEGPRSEVALFQEEFAAFHGAKYGIACNNGTGALDMIVRAHGIGPGDEVIVPAYTFVAGSTCVLQSNAVPVFADIDPETYNIDPACVEEAITDRTRAVIPCHFGGQIADMDGILKLGRKHDLVVIEDAAHAHGSEWDGKKAGTIGNSGMFSFQLSKNMTAGEGGIVLTDDDKLAERVDSLAWSGRKKGRPWYEFHQLGWNYRMLEFQGAILRVQLKRLDEQNQTRRENAAYLTGLMKEIEGLEPVKICLRGKKYSVHIFMLRYDPDAFNGLPRSIMLEAVNAEGIPAFSGYAHPLYKNPMYLNKNFAGSSFPLGTSFHEDIDYRAFEEKCPVAERACNYEAVWLEQRLFLGSKKDMDDIAEAFRKVKENVGDLM